MSYSSTSFLKTIYGQNLINICFTNFTSNFIKENWKMANNTNKFNKVFLLVSCISWQLFIFLWSGRKWSKPIWLQQFYFETLLFLYDLYPLREHYITHWKPWMYFSSPPSLSLIRREPMKKRIYQLNSTVESLISGILHIWAWF